MKQLVAYILLMIAGFTLNHLKARHEAELASEAKEAEQPVLIAIDTNVFVSNPAVDSDLLVCIISSAE